MDNQFPYLDPGYAESQPTTTAAISTSQLTSSYPTTAPLMQDTQGLYAFNDDSSFTSQPYYAPDLPAMPQDVVSGSLQFGGGDLPGSASPQDDIKSVSDVMKDRRREKNRASQAAFRERRKVVIEGLKEKLDNLEKACDDLKTENSVLHSQQDGLRAELERLSEENRRLRTSIASSPSSEGTRRLSEVGEQQEAVRIASEHALERWRPR